MKNLPGVLQAFTADELTSAKARVERLQQLQATANEAWRQVRWTADVIAQARDRGRRTGLLQLRALLDAGPTTTQDDDNGHCQLSVCPV